MKLGRAPTTFRIFMVISIAHCIPYRCVWRFHVENSVWSDGPAGPVERTGWRLAPDSADRLQARISIKGRKARRSGRDIHVIERLCRRSDAASDPEVHTRCWRDGAE